MKTLAGIFLAIDMFLFGGCTNPSPDKTTRSDSNPSYDVSLLFDHDGCKVYRFYDIGTARYFVKCGNSSSTSYSYMQGKMQRHEIIHSSQE